jgi:hypothetical protein
MILNKTNLDRIDLCEHVLAHWEGIIELGGTPVENLRLFTNEIQCLQNLREQDPERVDGLIERLRAVIAALSANIQ